MFPIRTGRTQRRRQQQEALVAVVVSTVDHGLRANRLRGYDGAGRKGSRTPRSMLTGETNENISACLRIGLELLELLQLNVVGETTALGKHSRHRLGKPTNYGSLLVVVDLCQRLEQTVHAPALWCLFEAHK